MDGNDIPANHNLVLLASDCSSLSAHTLELSLSLCTPPGLTSPVLLLSLTHMPVHTRTRARAPILLGLTHGTHLACPEGYRLHELQQTFTQCCFMLPFTCHTCTVTNPACCDKCCGEPMQCKWVVACSTLLHPTALLPVWEMTRRARCLAP